MSYGYENLHGFILRHPVTSNFSDQGPCIGWRFNESIVGHASGHPDSLRTNLMAAITDKDYKFLDGHFINANTILHYGGPTESLNRFLTRLGA